jgi:hypothetical protein
MEKTRKRILDQSKTEREKNFKNFSQDVDGGG